MSDFVKLEKFDGIAIATLNSPDTRNALSSEREYAAVEAACRDIQNDRTVRTAVLTGAGKAFCAGGNIKAMHERAENPSSPPVEQRYQYREGIQRIALAVHHLEVPVIAAVNGAAIGAGLNLACMCDIRVAVETAGCAES